MASPFDTVVAPITGSGTAPVAILRISGEEAWRIACALTGQNESGTTPRFAHFVTYATGDEGYLILFEQGRSYTGEPSAELSIHGSRASTQALLSAAIDLGARLAEPGEFTQRRFMNGRIDLTEAEAVRDTIEAETDAQLRLAGTLRQGALHRSVTLIVDDLTGILAMIEASVDFSEEVGDVDSTSLADRIQSVRKQCLQLRESAPIGRIMREGLRIAIVGPPNVGKSSLLNRLLSKDRSIVTDVPGTTRDYVEERLDLDGYPVVLIDTAGFRKSDDPVEAIGIQRSRAIAANADLVWFITDARQPENADNWSFERPVLWVANKVDLAPPPSGFLGISCATGEGIANLISEAKSKFEMPLGFAIQSRHEMELAEAERELELAQDALEHGRPPDLAAVGIRAAVRSLGRITGVTADADIIARIFRDFCIGK